MAATYLTSQHNTSPKSWDRAPLLLKTVCKPAAGHLGEEYLPSLVWFGCSLVLNNVQMFLISERFVLQAESGLFY